MMLAEQRLDQEYEKAQDRQHDERGNIGIEAERGVEAEAQIHPDCQEIAVGEIDDAADAENDGHAQRDQSVAAADQNPLCQNLNECIHVAPHRPR
jgi:hypothetical protein